MFVVKIFSGCNFSKAFIASEGILTPKSKFVFMKKLFVKFCQSIMIVAAVATVSPIHAQLESSDIGSGKLPLHKVKVTIPEQWKNFIIREDEGNSITFSLADGNAVPTFLFSITQIPEDQWVKTKAYFSEVRMIAQKDGMIYFSQVNKKETIKGPNSSLYQQIHPSIDEMIKNIQID